MVHLGTIAQDRIDEMNRPPEEVPVETAAEKAKNAWRPLIRELRKKQRGLHAGTV